MRYFHSDTSSYSPAFIDTQARGTYIVLDEVRVVPLYAVVQYGDHHILPSVAPPPSPHHIHVRLAVMEVPITVLGTHTLTHTLSHTHNTIQLI